MPLGLTLLVLLLIMASLFGLSYCCIKYAPERANSREFGHYVTFLAKEPVTSS